MQFCSSCVRKHCCLEHGFRGGSRLKFESLSARHLDTYSKLIVLMPRKGNLLQRSPASMLRGIIGSPAPFEGVRRKFESFRSNNLHLNAWFHPTYLMRRWEFSGKLWIKVYNYSWKLYNIQCKQLKSKYLLVGSLTIGSWWWRRRSVDKEVLKLRAAIYLKMQKCIDDRLAWTIGSSGGIGRSVTAVV